MEKRSIIIKKIIPHSFFDDFGEKTSLRVLFKKKAFNRTSRGSLLQDVKEDQEIFFSSNRLNKKEDLLGLHSIFYEYLGSYYGGFSINESFYSPMFCLYNGLTFGRPIYIYIKPEKKKKAWKKYYLGTLPTRTKQGYFILNGVKKSIVSQLIRSPGIYPVSRGKSGSYPFGTKSQRFIHWDGIPYEFINWKGIYTPDKFHSSVFAKLQNKKLNRKNLVSLLNLLTFLGSVERDLFFLFRGIEIYKVMKHFSLELLLSFLKYKGNIKNVKKFVYYSKGVANWVDQHSFYVEKGIFLIEGNKIQLDSPWKIHNISKKLDKKDIYFKRLGSLFQKMNMSQREIFECLVSGEVRILRKELYHILFKRNISVFFNIDLPYWTQRKMSIDLNLFKKSSKIRKDQLLCLAQMISRQKKEEFFPSESTSLDRLCRRYGIYGYHFLMKYLSIGGYQSSFYKGTLPERLKKLKEGIFLLNRKYHIGELSQYLEETNPLSILTHLRKMTLLGPGGLSQDNIPMESRDIQISYCNQICPIESPEGKSIGVVSSPSKYARLNSEGILEAPYIKVENGQITNKIVYLTCDYFFKICSESIDKFKNGAIMQKILICRYMGNYYHFTMNEVEYIDCYSGQFISLSSSLIPFLEHNDGNRALMGSNMQRQSILPSSADSPCIGTGSEREVMLSLYESDNNFTNTLTYFSNSIWTSFFCCNHNMFRKMLFSNKSFLHIKNYIEKLFYTNLQFYPTREIEMTNQKTLATKETNYNYGEQVPSCGFFSKIKGCSSTGELSLGQNILVAFTSYSGYTFEDSIVISNRLIRENYFMTDHMKEIIIRANINDKMIDLRKIQSLKYLYSLGDYLKNMYLDDLVRKYGEEFTQKAQFDVVDLVYCYSESEKYSIKDALSDLEYKMSTQTLKRAHRFLLAQMIYSSIFSDITTNQRNKGVFDSFTYIAEKFSLITDRLSRYPMKRKKNKVGRNIEHYIFKKIYKLFLRRILKPINKQIVFSPQYSILLDRGKSWIYSTPLIFKRNFPFALKDNDILSTFSMRKSCDRWISGKYNSVLESMNILDIFLLSSDYGYYIERGSKGYLEVLYSDLMYKREKKLESILAKIIYHQNIESGDKMTGRYGNKGVISKIHREEDMPYLVDGTAIDMVLNPLGVSSRMNIGQLFELHLGSSSIYFGKKIQSFSANQTGLFFISVLRKYLYSIYSNRKQKTILRSMTNVQIIELSRKLFSGLRLEVVPFDSPSDLKMDYFENSSGHTSNTRAFLIDGKTGSLSKNPISYGYMYIMKLNHLADSKLHGRSTGSYNSLTQQPLKGKSNQGGQRIGEMEIWAFQSYGVAYTLQEMIAVKSDSVLFREKVVDPFIPSYHQIVYSSENVPESYYLLMTELRSLGIDSALISKKSI